jgi:hypothetical protein
MSLYFISELFCDHYRDDYDFYFDYEFYDYYRVAQNIYLFIRLYPNIDQDEGIAA